MTDLRRLRSNLYSTFWSLYGRYVWDDQCEPSRVSDPPECIVDIVQTRRRNANERVLDAGCGTGNYTIALAQVGFDVVGIDFAAGMLAKAQEKITDGLHRYVIFQQANLNQLLEFPQAHFDHIINMSVLQTVTDPLFTLSEFSRTLKPGGTLVLSLPRQNSLLFSQSMGELVRYRIQHLEQRTPGKILFVILKSYGDRCSHIPRWTVSQAQQLTNASGFKIISISEGRQILIVAEKVAA